MTLTGPTNSCSNGSEPLIFTFKFKPQFCNLTMLLCDRWRSPVLTQSFWMSTKEPMASSLFLTSPSSGKPSERFIHLADLALHCLRSGPGGDQNPGVVGGVGCGGGGAYLMTDLCMLILCFDIGCFNLSMKCMQYGSCEKGHSGIKWDGHHFLPLYTDVCTQTAPQCCCGFISFSFCFFVIG